MPHFYLKHVVNKKDLFGNKDCKQHTDLKSDKAISKERGQIFLLTNTARYRIMAPRRVSRFLNF